ncbi:disease resistance At1g50180 [Olea europaea subsp. europaea]|uniref:Disease resistance At1g50180 n=1 Tax=Olea europaea subsp. europaea TaxID=158383 RepID=A0A8S0UC69_OLEEU|nr:disease resistance At1g50180 [Olea europaea subsp. europaea]
MAAEAIILRSADLLVDFQKDLVLESVKGVQDADAKLRRWLCVLKDLDGRKSEDASVDNLKKDIRDLVCRLQDFLQIYSNKVQSGRGGGIINRLTEHIMAFNGINSFRMGRLELEEINTRITGTIQLLNDLRTVGVNKTEEERSHSANENPKPENQQKFWYLNPSVGGEHIVGRDDELETVTSFLIDDSHRVISIYGAAGIGKTALARELFRDPAIVDYYNIRVWIEMSLDISLENVLRKLVEQISKQVGGTTHLNLDIGESADFVRKSLKDKIYLVVLNDIWPLEGFNYLLSVLPNDRNGSKLMITTRLREVATYVAGGDRDGIIYTMKNLSTSKSSELFWKTAYFGDPQDVDPMKKQIGEEILEVCKGLPLPIVTIGRVLAGRHASSEWENMLQNSKSLMIRGLPVDQIAFEQSISAKIFEDLPYHLKQCFLYLGLFPKGCKIEVEHLYFLWMSEGMISRDGCQNNETVMDLAERYLSDLVHRKLVEVEAEETSSFRKYKSCRVYEDMQEHCLLKGGEYFFKVLDFGLRTQRRADSDSFSSSSNPVRRVALHIDKQDDRSSIDQLRNEKFYHLRSLLLLNLQDLQKLEWPERMFYLKRYRMLTVLYFKRVNFQGRGLPRELAWPIYLRYLSFNGCILGVLPSSIGNLSFLEILDLRVSSKVIIPNVLRKLVKLIYLYLPPVFQTPNNKKLYLGSLKEIEILENFDTGLCNVADLFEMTSLRYLSTIVEGILGDLEEIVRRMNMTSGNTSVLHPSISQKL